MELNWNYNRYLPAVFRFLFNFSRGVKSHDMWLTYEHWWLHANYFSLWTVYGNSEFYIYFFPKEKWKIIFCITYWKQTMATEKTRFPSFEQL